MTAAAPSATRRADQSRTRGIVNTLWLVNGQPTGVDPADRGLAYGDGLFETMAASDGRIRWLDLHLDRLEEGCRRLEIPAPSRSLLAHEIDAHCPRTGPRRRQAHRDSRPGRARLLAAGDGDTDARARDLAVARVSRRRTIATGSACGRAGCGSRRTRRSPASSISAASSRCSRSSSFADTPCSKACMLDASGYVVGGTSSNVFVVGGGGLEHAEPHALRHQGRHAARRSRSGTHARDSRRGARPPAGRARSAPTRCSSRTPCSVFGPSRSSTAGGLQSARRPNASWRT